MCELFYPEGGYLVLAYCISSFLSIILYTVIRFLRQRLLLFVVFITGACVLVIEVVATRILSPYFGNTIFTFSSVISVILGALSVGYYYGGKIADKYPNSKVFYGIILVSGFSVLLLQLLSLTVLPIIGYKLSIVSGPLITSILLFLLPSVFLGMLSPYAIKLQKAIVPKKGIGTMAGEIFFWSTLGSIFGSLAAGFLLIPFFGVDQIIFSCAVVLIILGLVPLIFLKFEKKYMVFAIILFSIFSGTIFSIIFTPRKVVYQGDGIYEKITIFDDRLLDGRKTRFLLMDKSNAGAMLLDSDDLAYDYSKYYRVYKLFTPKVSDALVLGGGAYSIPKGILAEIEGVTVDVSEIEPSLYELAKKYFELSENKRLKNYVVDGRRFLYDSQKKYDLIFSDVYFSLYSIPIHFTTCEFFELVKDKMRDDGIFIANLIGALDPERSPFLFSEIKTLQKVFPNYYLFATVSPDKTFEQNLIYVGYKSEKKVDFSLGFESDDETIRDLSKKRVNMEKYDFSPYPILSDNYSPVEYLTGRFLSSVSFKTD